MLLKKCTKDLWDFGSATSKAILLVLLEIVSRTESEKFESNSFPKIINYLKNQIYY